MAEGIRGLGMSDPLAQRTAAGVQPRHTHPEILDLQSLNPGRTTCAKHFFRVTKARKWTQSTWPVLVSVLRSERLVLESPFHAGERTTERGGEQFYPPSSSTTVASTGILSLAKTVDSVFAKARGQTCRPGSDVINTVPASCRRACCYSLGGRHF